MTSELLRSRLDEMVQYLHQGGHVMIPLIVMTFVLWYALGYRLLVLRRGTGERLGAMIARCRKGSLGRPRGIIDSAISRGVEAERRYPHNLRACLEDIFVPLRDRMGTHAALARTLVMIAPLAGLLGTVSGMMEMFDSLADQTFISQSGGIARGIAEALFTTQLGLAIAIPGFIVSRVLERRQERLHQELEEVKELMVGTQHEARVI